MKRFYREDSHSYGVRQEIVQADQQRTDAKFVHMSDSDLLYQMDCAELHRDREVYVKADRELTRRGYVPPVDEYEHFDRGLC